MSMRTRIVLLILFFQVSGGFILQAQDLHFSQWFNEPLLTNPANTGFIPDADYRLGANYRNQWSSVMSEPYKTMSIWGDAQVMRGLFSALAAWKARHFEAKLDILCHRQPREESELLKN